MAVPAVLTTAILFSGTGPNLTLWKMTPLNQLPKICHHSLHWRYANWRKCVPEASEKMGKTVTVILFIYMFFGDMP